MVSPFEADEHLVASLLLNLLRLLRMWKFRKTKMVRPVG